jgi:hypothetical protein
MKEAAEGLHVPAGLHSLQYCRLVLPAVKEHLRGRSKLNRARVRKVAQWAEGGQS